MSKAFVRDDLSDNQHDNEDEDLGQAQDSALPVNFKNYMTPAGYGKMRAEFKHLLDVDRPEVVRTVSWAAANGDRSENGDYIYGKRRLREIDRRLRFLTKRLESAEVVDPVSRPATDQIYFGATVRYSRNRGSEETVSIVGIDEADPLRGRISWISPIAKALIKAREGDIVTLRTPTGFDAIEIVTVSYQVLD